MARPRDNLPRLNVAPSLNMQQPTMFSPALPTALQQSYHPPFPVSNSLQTPLHPYFTPQPPPAPGRPTHNQNRASIAHLAAAGIHPPNAYMTPVTAHFPRPSLVMGSGPPSKGPSSAHPFPNRNRRQLSIGGPPKAVLGGPSRKLSPLPTTPLVGTSSVPVKAKKVPINLPKETIPGEDGQPATRPTWARTPMIMATSMVEVQPVEPTTAECFPPDSWRCLMPDTLDVFLPGKVAWETLKQRAIEDKLEKLGVERGSGSNIPHIHAPHARAASISSPADPALLLFKLNKLHQAQEATSPANSVSSTLPHPWGFSPSPLQGAPGFPMTSRHGHTMSLAQPPTYQLAFGSAPLSANPFGPNAVLGSDLLNTATETSLSPAAIHAPQGRVPVNPLSLAPPLVASRPNSRPDFTRGFGLDITEEAEEEHEDIPETFKAVDKDVDNAFIDLDASQDMELDENDNGGIGHTHDASSVTTSRNHSRHISRPSATLSIRSVGDDLDVGIDEEEENNDSDKENVAEFSKRHEDDSVAAVDEWTGSEDAFGLDISEDESIGEWSNPSDEERARHQRVERRLRRRRLQQVDQPRRIPIFPHPPDNTVLLARDDEIISNPSEEGHLEDYRAVAGGNYNSRPPSELSNPSRPLPPLPHSRVASAQYSAHDPAQAHSRLPSDQFKVAANHQSRPSSSNLNPFAKPFVFGSARRDSAGSATWLGLGGTSTPPSASVATHSRLSSIGKPLNVAAPEFKPLGFTFKPPAGVPQMPVPVSEVARPLPMLPVEAESSPYKSQGREKRQRRVSNASIEEGDSMTSFKFPMKLESPQSIRRSGSTSDLDRAPQATTPFTFAGFSAVANLPYVPPSDHAPPMPIPDVFDETVDDESTTKAENTEAQIELFTFPTSATKPKRAPIPLDFKHPVSSNTVPAGLFKALNNSDEKTRRGVRSRLSSREIYEHTQLPSMDDLNMPPIARRVERGRLVTDPGHATPSEDDVFASPRHGRRRSSLPDALRDDISSPSRNSGPQDLTGRMEIHHIEQVVGGLLDEKFAALGHDLARRDHNTTHKLPLSTEAMLADVVSLFRAQLQESAARGMDDSHDDAHGELDFQLVKDTVENGNKELLSIFKQELHTLTHQINHGNSTAQDVSKLIEQMGNRTVNAVVEMISELSARQDNLIQTTSARERDVLVDKLINVLAPMLNSLQPEPVDYDFLTNQLTQAVKPHISQLIDLASDKRETAGLIVDRILPLLPSLKNSPIDVDTITLQLVTEVRRAIAPIDAHVIKEHVADLVVERLDSRLAVRDKAFNLDTLTSNVLEGVSQLLKPSQGLPESIDKLVVSQKELKDQQATVVTTNLQVLTDVTALPAKFDKTVERLNAVQADILAKLDTPAYAPNPAADQTALETKSIVGELKVGQQALVDNNSQIVSLQNDVLARLDAFPETVTTITNVVQKSLAELISANNIPLRELDELRKANADLQINITKARAAHGQVRVEKDMLGEKLTATEKERDSLQVQLKDHQVATTVKTSEALALTTRNAELEEALAKALARLQSADVASQAQQKYITDLEKGNKDLTAEKQTMKSKVDSLELQVTFATRDKESSTHALEVLQLQHDRLSSQQSHWDDLRQASEKIEMLTNLIGQADNDELKELRRHRDRSKVLEGEHAALQKRIKDFESKTANSERAAATARQSLAQAQQRSAEWERRAKEYEGQLEMLKTQFDQAEQTRNQLDADHSLLKLQLEERDADDRLHKDRENKLLDQVSGLEAKISRLYLDLETARTSKPPIIAKSYQNGNTHAPPRPDSRASTIYEKRSATPTRRVSTYTSSGRSDTPPQASVWDSMHAPSATNIPSKYPSPNLRSSFGRYPNLGPTTPKAQRPTYPQQLHRPSMPSPTPSTVSLAPTQGDDGWWA